MEAKSWPRSSWMPRILAFSDILALMKMAEEADVVPRCPVIKPSIYNHTCSTLCPWFAPPMGWNAFYGRKHSTYVGRNYSDDEDLLPDEGESDGDVGYF